VYIQGLQLSVN